MAALKEKLHASEPQKAGRVRTLRRAAKVVDLEVNRESESYRITKHAYDTAERVSTEGMSRSEFLAAIKGKTSGK